jgi:hypothetical protein
MTYTLNCKETGNKAARYHYTVTDEAGNIISERKSNRQYVACTIYGEFYFGRLDLIGKGDHGRRLKFLALGTPLVDENGHRIVKDGTWIFDGIPVEPTPIAYLKP